VFICRLSVYIAMAFMVWNLLGITRANPNRSRSNLIHMQVKDYNVQEISGGVGQVQEKLEFAGLRRSWFFCAVYRFCFANSQPRTFTWIYVPSDILERNLEFFSLGFIWPKTSKSTGSIGLPYCITSVHIGNILQRRRSTVHSTL